MCGWRAEDPSPLGLDLIVELDETDEGDKNVCGECAECTLIEQGMPLPAGLSVSLSSASSDLLIIDDHDVMVHTSTACTLEPQPSMVVHCGMSC